MFSVIIPTFNNIEYLKLCLNSIKKNSKFNHEIIVHINIGSDGTIEYLKDQSIKYTFTKYNAGICEGVNKAAKLSTTNYILYSHDDFYFCPSWDETLINEVKKINSEYFYLSGTMIQNGQVELNCGYNLSTFQENKLLNEYKDIDFYDFQGSTWAPHLIHKNVWKKVGGFSEEFYPGTGSDPDLNKKLWDQGVRIFKGLQHCKVYHFGSIVTRQKEKNFNAKTESGSRGSKIFLLKWGMSINFFKKYYLKSDTKYIGPLTEPYKSFGFYFNFFLCKLNYIYLRLFFKF